MNTIITISRQFGSQGHEIGRKLAEELGVNYAFSTNLEIYKLHDFAKDKDTEGPFDELPPHEWVWNWDQTVKEKAAKKNNPKPKTRFNPAEMAIEELLAKLEDSGWYRRQAQAESVLLGLGFSREDFTKRTEEFSGGWQMRIALAKSLMQNPDILLLDEPTNDLDITTTRSLEEAINEFAGVVLVVSHDRYFLDRICTHILAFENNSEVKWFEGNWSEYVEWKKKVLGIDDDIPHKTVYRKLTR